MPDLGLLLRVQRRTTQAAQTTPSEGFSMSWIAAAILFLLLIWTLLPGGLAAITWSFGHTIGQKLAKRAFSNPTGKGDEET